MLFRSGRGLVRDEQLRLAGKGHGDHHPLGHAARHLVGVRLETPFRVRDPDHPEQVEIPDAQRRLSAFPHQLSGGMSQRVMVAMAIACNPRLLIADEPTTALDVTIQAQILDLLRDLQRDRGMALVLVTHNMGVVADMNKSSAGFVHRSLMR